MIMNAKCAIYSFVNFLPLEINEDVCHDFECVIQLMQASTTLLSLWVIAPKEFTTDYKFGHKKKTRFPEKTISIYINMYTCVLVFPVFRVCRRQNIRGLVSSIFLST